MWGRWESLSLRSLSLWVNLDVISLMTNLGAGVWLVRCVVVIWKIALGVEDEAQKPCERKEHTGLSQTQWGNGHGDREQAQEVLGSIAGRVRTLEKSNLWWFPFFRSGDTVNCPIYKDREWGLGRSLVAGLERKVELHRGTDISTLLKTFHPELRREFKNIQR